MSTRLVAFRAFPRVILPYGTAEDLFRSMCEVVRKHHANRVASCSRSLRGNGHLAPASAASAPVCVALIGPRSDERQQLLKLVHVSSPPLHLAGCTLSELRSLPPTLQSGSSSSNTARTSSVARILRATSSRDAHLFRTGVGQRFIALKSSVSKAPGARACQTPRPSRSLYRARRARCRCSMINSRSKSPMNFKQN